MGAAQLVAWFLALAAAAGAAVSAAGARPSEVALGALFTYDSTIGRAARLAIELAVDDVNADGTVLSGTKLSLKSRDTNCSAFIGTVEGWSFFFTSSLSLSCSMSMRQELELPCQELKLPCRELEFPLK